MRRCMSRGPDAYSIAVCLLPACAGVAGEVLAVKTVQRGAVRAMML